MSDSSQCPQCGTPLAPDSPQGLCPQCLLKQGFDGGDKGQDATIAPEKRFVAPTTSELAKSFPELEILETLGQGGFGAVYRVRQRSLDRVVALKILSPEAAQDPAFAERFAREAKAMAKLMHPNIVLVFEFGPRDKFFYLIMEYVDGVNLREAIQAGQLSHQQALAIVPQICDALEYAHDEGVVHRDIKPENILLDKKGRVKIADFGLAKLLGRSPVDITLTASHQVMGTLHYMAPEQIQTPLEVDHRADIYSLGVVFYELLTGDLPLGRFKLPSERANVDERLDNVVLKTLEHKPDARYQHASDVKLDVETISRAGHVSNIPSVEKRQDGSTDSTKVTQGASRAIALPFFITDANSGVKKTEGIVRFTGSEVEMEFEASGWAKHWTNQQVKLVTIPIENVTSAGLKNVTITVQTDQIQTIADVPKERPGEIQLRVDRQNWRAARRFVSVMNRCMSGESFENALETDTSDQFTDDDFEVASQILAAPMLMMIVFGSLNVALPALVAIVLGIIGTSTRIDDDMFIYCAVCLPGAAFGIVMLLGGIWARRMKVYELAFIGSILGLIPLSPFWLITLPMGIWWLVVLCKPEVSTAFRHPGREAFLARRTRDREEVDIDEDAFEMIHRQIKVPGRVAIGVGITIILLPVIVGMIAWMCYVWIRGVDDDALLFASLLFLPGILTGALMLPGAWSMCRMGSRGLAIFSSIIAMLPLGPVWILTFPVGIWMLALLLRRDVQRAFIHSQKEEFLQHALDVMDNSNRLDERYAAAPQKFAAAPNWDLELETQRAERRVRGPAFGLITVGVLNLVPIAMGIYFLFYQFIALEQLPLGAIFPMSPNAQIVLAQSAGVSWMPVFLGVLFLIGLSGTLILGGWKMGRLEHYGLAVFASVLATLPCHLGFITGLPIGIWSLVVLLRRDVKDAFKSKAEMRDEEKWT